MARYLMRFDDINSRIDWEKFFKIKKVLEKHNIKSILGVVPNCLDRNLYSSKPLNNYFDYLRDCKKYGDFIAQHGYTHIYDSKSKGIFGSSHNSEFAGHTLKEQIRRISLGKQILKKERLWQPIFMAPSHSFDINTIIALKNFKFKFILDGFSLFPYQENNLNFIPQIVSKPLPKKLPCISQLCIHINTISNQDLSNLIYFIENNHEKFTTIDQIKSNEYLLKFIDKIITYFFIFFYRIIKKLISKIISYFLKLRCLIQRIQYRIRLRKYCLDKWYLQGTYFCRAYKMKSLNIINYLKPDIFIDIGCGLGEILQRVDLPYQRKIGFDKNTKLTEPISKLNKNNFLYFSKVDQLFNYAINLKKSYKGLVIISMLNFSHTLSEEELLKTLEIYKNKIGTFLLIIDNINEVAIEYKYNHYSFFNDHKGLIKCWPNIDKLRSIYCIKIR